MISGPNMTVAYLASVPFIPSNNLVAVEGENPFYNGPNIIMTNMHWGKLRVSVRELHLPAGIMDRESALANNLLVEEQRVLCSLRHPGLLCLMGISLIHEIVSPRLVFERVHLGSLFFMLHTKQSNSLGMLYNTKIHLLIQVCEALQYLHDQGWIHCAITSHAIYMVSPTIARLGGLCYAKKRDSVNPCISTPPIVWNRWLPIEVIRGSHRINTKSDVYSICTIIHEILTGSPPWANVDDHDVRNLLSTGYQHPVDDYVSESLSGILHVGLAVKARHRHLCLQDILNTLQSEHAASIKKSTCCYSDATILQDIPLSRTTLHTAAKSDPFNICSEIPEKLLESQNQHDNHGATGEMRWCAWRKEGLQELLTCTNEFFTPQRILSTHVVNEDPDISDSSTGTFERNMDSLVDTYKPQSSEDGESATEPPNDITCSSPTHQMWDTDSVQDDTHNPHIQDTIWHMSVTRSRDSRTENVSHWQSALDIQTQNITIKQTSDIQKSESCDRSLYKSFLQDDEDQDSIDTERKESQGFPRKDLGSDETFKFKETVIEAAHVSVLEDKTASEQFLLVCRHEAENYSS
uniref:Protein kinase domain-containing protein n=1 Tax=Eptatretus burgeri TaxID=7764 RepID=A0A8C4QHV6_EPTBU